jgi:hypothetical protein
MSTESASATTIGELHDAMMPLLEAMFSEFKELSKKKPEAAVSKNKILVVNRLLEKIREIVAGETSLQYLDLLDVDDVPQVSDATLMLSQYVAAMKGFKDKYRRWNGSNHVWIV